MLLSHSCFLTSLFILSVFLYSPFSFLFLYSLFLPYFPLFLSCYFFSRVFPCSLLASRYSFSSSCCYSLCIAKAFFYYLLWWVLIFYPSTTFGLVWVSFPNHPLVYRLPSHHHYLVLAVPRSIPRQKSFVLFSWSPWHSHLDKSWVFSLTNSYGMHLVILAHLSLFWVVCHPSKTFPLKELERESLNRLPPSLHRQTIPSLTSDPWPTALALAWYKWVVPEPCACSTFMWIHDLSVVHAFAIV